MAWYVDTVRIFVQDEIETAKQIIARLQPLGGGTVHHVFGYEDKVYKVTGFVVGSGEILTLEGYTQDGVTHTFSTPYYGNLVTYVNNVQAKPMNVICQTFDTTQPEDAPVYTVDVELLLNA
jgi:hypothetical protein